MSRFVQGDDDLSFAIVIEVRVPPGRDGAFISCPLIDDQQHLNRLNSPGTEIMSQVMKPEIFDPCPLATFSETPAHPAAIKGPFPNYRYPVQPNIPNLVETEKPGINFSAIGIQDGITGNDHKSL